MQKKEENYYLSIKNLLDVFDTFPITKSEEERATLIANVILDSYDKRSLKQVKVISINELFSKALIDFNELGFTDVTHRAVSILSSIKYKYNEKASDYEFTILQDIKEDKNSWIRETKGIIVPNTITVSSIPFLMHEVTHMLKDVNPLECRGYFTDNEVIPMFMELIDGLYNQNNDVFKKREFMLLNASTIFKRINNWGTKENDDVILTQYNLAVSYLNSFYYTLKLLAMYRCNERGTVTLVNEVLSGYISTRELDSLLDSINIPYESGLDIFQRGLI